MNGIEGVALWRRTASKRGNLADEFFLHNGSYDWIPGVWFPEPVAAALVVVAEAAASCLGAGGATNDDVAAALDALTAARGPHEAKGDG